jgi:hypothetical protein
MRARGAVHMWELVRRGPAKLHQRMPVTRVTRDTGTVGGRRRRSAQAAGLAVGHQLAVGVFVVLALLVKLPQVLAPMGQDQGLYHTVGQAILAGAVPYRDAWDPKPPGVFYTHAAVLALAPDPWRTCRIQPLPGLSRADLQPRCGALLFGAVDFVYSLLLGVLVYRLARRLDLGATAAAIAFGFTAIFVNLALLDPEGSTPEKYALGPAIGVVLAGLTAIESRRRRWLVVAGVLGAIAALFKPPDLASLGALSLMLLALRRWQDLIWLWVPPLLVLTAVVFAFTVVGAGGQLIEATFTYNFARFGFQSQRIPLTALVAAWQVFRDGLAVLWLPALLGVVIVWQRPVWRVLVVWAVLDVLALFLGGTKFTREYFVQLVPSFALLAGAAVAWLLRSQAREWPAQAWVVLSLAGIAVLSSAFQAGFTVRIWNEYVANGWTTTSVEHLASMIGSLPPDETLFVWGDEAELYTLSGRRPTTRFLNTTGLAATGDAAANQRRTEMLASLLRAPPAVVVVDRRTADDDPDGRLGLNLRYFPELQRLLDGQYRPMDDSVLRAYLGGDREQVFVRTGTPDVCQQMPGCRLK